MYQVRQSDMMDLKKNIYILQCSRQTCNSNHTSMLKRSGLSEAVRICVDLGEEPHSHTGCAFRKADDGVLCSHVLFQCISKAFC